MKTIILAGEGKKDETGFPVSKGAFPMKGIPMIQYVVNCLRSSGCVDTLIAVGNLQDLKPIIDSQVDLLLQQKSSMMDNLLEALSYVEGEEAVLITTCDIPLIHRDVVKSFIETALEMKVDICYPIVEKQICQKCYPDVKRTYVHLKDGSFTGGNMIVLSPPAIDKIEAPARWMIKYRKNPIKMSRALGFKFILGALFQQLTINGLEGYIEKRFGIRARAVISQYPEIASDIDNIRDVQQMEKYL
ncbi:molybdopterin-guanine dinucleotide biosynthesis protein A [Clostridium aceticum]|uniref:Molybdopterin-guanine dinucleotide biosynthesis protein A n=1 Tax=Clostridium aceticum TaxID=84022 RepID=A0A0D8I543_9CLOT|nr:nucleotidyltransferase family protein [Clostridium aceticum]AKL97135.1 molybdopterin-guanine dinucleotide biosynthesis protein A [Clostridium aceticum]KJF25395.1 hypothetical protein TZ02_18870 [Clostridium aceticum]